MKTRSKFTRIIGMGLTVTMLASTLLTAVPVSADVSSVTASASNTTVAANATYDIRFTANNAITRDADGNGGNITITFPSGFTLANNTTANTSATLTGASIAAGQGWLNATTYSTPNFTVSSWNISSSRRKVQITLNQNGAIGSGADVRIIIPSSWITNPTTPGSYTVTVDTSNDTTAVTSASFSITLPNIGPLAGQVEGKNSAGDVLYRDITSNLATVIGTAGVVRIELGAGTYNASNTASTVNQTIIGVGAAGTVILTAPAGSPPLTVSATGVVIENLVIQGNGNGVDDLVDATANSTFRNVTFNGGVNQLDITSTTVQAFSVLNSIFNVTGNVSIGINSASANASQVQLTVSNCTFNVDAGGDAVVSTSNLTLSNSTFTGSSTSPDGVLTSNGTSTITNNTFTKITRAIVVSGNTSIAGTLNGTVVTATGNTITGNGATSASSSAGAIVCSGGLLEMRNNTISAIGSIYYAFHVSGGNVTARFNSITGNTLNARQTSGTGNLTHNYWGTTTGPAASSLNATTASLLVTTPYLKTAPSAGSMAMTPTSNLTARDTSGVDISTANGTVNYAIAAKYAANPETVAPPGTPVAYFDVSIGVPSGAEPGSVTIRFYANVAASSKVYYGGGLAGGWTEVATQGVNVNGGYAYVIITGTSIPNYADLTGTPFVVSNFIATPSAVTLTGPAIGATNVPVNTAFSWSAVTGATYAWQLSTSPTFATLTANASGLTSNVYGLTTPLAANTTYYWRVQANVGTLIGPWTIGTFTTAAPAAPTTPPVINVAPPTVNVAAPAAPLVTVQAPPPAVVNIAPAAVTVQAPPPAVVTVNIPEQAPLIPQYLLWTILLIGAVLVIALIVLIVRTRRVA